MASVLRTPTRVSCDDKDNCRKRSIDSTQAPSQSSGYTSSGDDSPSSPKRAASVDNQCEPDSALHGTSAFSDAFDEATRPMMACMSEKNRPTVRPGTSMRVWRRRLSTPRMEWSEVIRRSTVAGIDWFFCETLLSELFEFSPQLVAERCDETVEAYEMVLEDSEKRKLREREVERLQQALSGQGQLKDLPCGLDYRYPGFIVAPSQFHVKATSLSGETANERRMLQESVQRKLLLDSANGHHRQTTCRGLNDIDKSVVQRPGMNNRKPALPRWLQAVKAWPRATAKESDPPQSQSSLGDVLESTNTCPENPARHLPELCSDCIRTGAWCTGSLHLPSATTRLHTAVSSLHSHVCWSPCECGIEAEIEYEGERVLLQIRPSLFCVPESDAMLFG